MDGKWYNLAPSGEMRTGWIYDTDGSIYFTDSSGAMQTGVIQVEGKSYVLGENGAMLIGNNVSFENGIYTTDDKGVIIQGNTLTENRTYTKEGVLVIPDTSSNQDTDKAASTEGNSSNNTETSSSSSSSSAKKKISKIDTISDIEVANGTDLDEVGLPGDVDIRLSDNATTSAAVTWDGGTPNYDGDIAGTYTFTGTLNLPSGVSNPNNIKASVNVVVKGLLNFPFSASVDGDGNVYIANLNGRNVIKYDSNGIYQYTINSGASIVTGVTVSNSGTVYVSDYYNNRIVTYDSQGNMIGTPITHSGYFLPMQVALDSEGNIYAGNNGYGYGYEYEYDGLVKFDSAGQYVSNLGNTIFWAVAIDNNDNIYAAYDYGKIYKMNSSGATLEIIDLGGYYIISEMMCDSSGNLYVLGNDGSVKVIDSNGNVIRTITTTVTNNSYVYRTIALDNENNIYFVDGANNRVVKFDNDGNYIREFR